MINNIGKQSCSLEQINQYRDIGPLRLRAHAPFTVMPLAAPDLSALQWSMQLADRQPYSAFCSAFHSRGHGLAFTQNTDSVYKLIIGSVDSSFPEKPAANNSKIKSLPLGKLHSLRFPIAFFIGERDVFIDLNRSGM